MVFSESEKHYGIDLSNNGTVSTLTQGNYVSVRGEEALPDDKISSFRVGIFTQADTIDTRIGVTSTPIGFNIYENSDDFTATNEKGW